MSLKPVSHGSGGVCPVELDRLDHLPVSVRHESLAVHHLEDHLVDVHRVGVAGGVVELPDLGRTDGRVLGHRLHPQLRFGDVVHDGAEERLDGPSTSLPSASWPMPIFSISASGRVIVSAGSGVIAGSWRNCGGVESSTPTAGTTRTA